MTMAMAMALLPAAVYRWHHEEEARAIGRCSTVVKGAHFSPPRIKVVQLIIYYHGIVLY